MSGSALEIADRLESRYAEHDGGRAQYLSELELRAVVQLRHLHAELARATRQEADLRQYHYKQNADMVAQLAALRSALTMVVQHTLPDTMRAPSRMLAMPEPWPTVAKALWPDA